MMTVRRSFTAHTKGIPSYYCIFWIVIDIYLYDVSGDSATPLHGWANVPTADGNLTTTLYVGRATS